MSAHHPPEPVSLQSSNSTAPHDARFLGEGDLTSVTLVVL